MKAIVLGATGFIGSHIVRALQSEEMDVRILRRSSSPPQALEGLNPEERLGDLDDRASLIQAFRGCHVLFHAAGYYPIYSFHRQQQKNRALQQMRNVLQAAETAGIRKIVYTSSLSTIGNPPTPPLTKGGPGGFLADEETPYDPRLFTGLYYEIKYLLEQEALQAASRGLPITIVNPTGVFGDYDVKPTSGIFILKIARLEVPFLIDAKLNAVDVRDVALAQVAALKLGKIGRRYILGGHNTTIWKMGQLIARVANVPPPRLKLPLWVGRLAAPFSEWIEGKWLHHERPSVPQVGIDFLKYGTHVSSQRAETELGLGKHPLEETVQRALQWFRKNGTY